MEAIHLRAGLGIANHAKPQEETNKEYKYDDNKKDSATAPLTLR